MEARLPSLVHRSGKMRVDAIVFEDGEALAAVEIKTDGTPPLNVTSRQARAYRGVDLPVFVCLGMKDIAATMQCLERQSHWNRLDIPAGYVTN